MGVLDAWMWARETKAEPGARPGVSESLRWREGDERIAERAAALPDTRLGYVAEREADILALMQRAHALGNPADWLIRAKHNRKLDAEESTLWDLAAEAAVLGELRFYLPPRPGRKGRHVVQQVRALRVRLPAEDGGAFEATALVARAMNPPPGEKPLEWRRLTNREASRLAEAAEWVDWYRCRWEIERFFNILKNGCKVDALQLSAMPRIALALALFRIVAGRIAYLMRLGRTCPEMDCEVAFEREEWQAAWIVARQPIPPEPPKLNDAIRLIARFGGFLGRNGDGEPGAKTLWQGLQRVMDFAMGIRAARDAEICV